MEVTNEDKYKILRRALSLLESGTIHYLCPAIKNSAVKITGQKYPNAWDLIPEMLDFKPDSIPMEYLNSPWFDFEDVNSRINIIRKLMIIYSERIPHLTEDDINKLIFGE